MRFCHLAICFFCLFLLLSFPVGCIAQSSAPLSFPELDAEAEDRLNLYCLRLAYATITALETESDGRSWLLFRDGQRVLYSQASNTGAGRNSDVRSTMAGVYPLEPQRFVEDRDTVLGKRRSYALLQAIYGEDTAAVSKGLQTAYVQGKAVRMSRMAALALQKADAHLVLAVNREPAIYPLLDAESGIGQRQAPCGEPSPHVFGLAVDLSIDHAPSWQGSPHRQHPLQQSYPTAIVSALEKQGFIWGGKWQEYELAHFEYRPELIYKAHLVHALAQIRAISH